MTDRTIIEAVERVIANIQADRDFWSRYNQAPCYYQLTSSPEDAMIIQTVLEDWLYGTENSPSDERKGEGWSTISVDENVGSNAAISAADAIVKMGEAFDLFAKATADMVRNKE